MDIFFQPTIGKNFWMEVGYFDTVLEIKEKIQKYQCISVSDQTLKFGGNVLPDDLNVHYSEILDKSRIEVVVNVASPETLEISDHHKSSSPRMKKNNNYINHEISDHHKSSSPSTKKKNNYINQEICDHHKSSSPPTKKKKIKLLLKISSNILKFSGTGGAVLDLEMEVTDTVKKLKERVHREKKMGDVSPVSVIIMQPNGVELQDQRTLEECQVGDGSEIEVIMRAQSSTTSTGWTSNGMMSYVGGGGGGGARKSIITVLSKCGKKIPIEVNLWDNIRVLKKELDKANKQMNLNLEILKEDYFFIFKQNVMDENRSFRWHRVRQGDTIEIFNGSVSMGS